MTWEFVKKWLYKKQRVEELNNKGTDNEILTLWNGLILVKFMPENWINGMWRSGRPIKLIRKIKIAEAKTIYDYPEYRDEICGEIFPPDKRGGQLDIFNTYH